MSGSQIVIIVLAAMGLALLGVLTGVLVSTLLEVKSAVRELREAVARLVPAAEETLENLRQVSGTAAKASELLEKAGPAIGPISKWAGKISRWLPMVAGVAGFAATLRGLRPGKPERNVDDRR